MSTKKQSMNLQAMLRQFKLGENLVSLAIIIIAVAIGLVGVTVGGPLGTLLIILGIILAALGGIIKGVFPG